MVTIIYILITLVFIGFFSGVEIAFVSSNKLNIELKRKQGSYSGKVLSRFMENPATFIGTSLVGVNIGLVIYGLLMTQATDHLFNAIHFPENEYLRLFTDTIIATVVVLLVGEFLPKAIFRAKPETMLSVLTLPVQLFYYLFYPIAQLFVRISEFLLKYLFNVRINEEKNIFSRVDLEQFVKQMRTGHDSEEEDSTNTELFENALSLATVRVRECLIPRNEIECVSLSDSMAEVKEMFLSTKLSKLIVYENSVDNIVGYLHHLDMLKKPSSIQPILHPIITIPETMSVVDLLNQFTRERKSIAWVIDEFGGTAGIVTMEDILEEIFGEIHDEFDEEEYVEKQLAANEYIFSARLEIDYLNEKYNLNLPVDDAETLSGYIIENHESIPKPKERIIIGNYEYVILSGSNTRIETVKVKTLQGSK
jgi:putative hemolysin